MDRETKRRMIKAIKNAEYAIVITDKKVGMSDTNGKQVAILLGGLALSLYEQGVPIEIIKELFNIGIKALGEASKEEK